MWSDKIDETKLKDGIVNSEHVCDTDSIVIGNQDEGVCSSLRGRGWQARQVIWMEADVSSAEIAEEYPPANTEKWKPGKTLSN